MKKSLSGTLLSRLCHPIIRDRAISLTLFDPLSLNGKTCQSWFSNMYMGVHTQFTV